MTFPNLVLEEDSSYHSQNQGIPDNGNNEFAHGIDPDIIRNHEHRLSFAVIPKGPSITGARYVGLSADLTKVTIAFTVLGGKAEAEVMATFKHSAIW